MRAGLSSAVLLCEKEDEGDALAHVSRLRVIEKVYALFLDICCHIAPQNLKALQLSRRALAKPAFSNDRR
jgi:hypothetical protein